MSGAKKRQPVRSMTGYARARRVCAAGEIQVALKSVNHRALDLHIQLPDELSAAEPAVRAALRERLKRGHIEVRVGFARAGSGPQAALNRPLFEACLQALKEAAEALRVEAPAVDLNGLLRVPGMVTAQAAEEAAPELEGETLAAIEEALDGLEAFRVREGEAIRAEMEKQNRRLEALAGEIEKNRHQAMPALQARLSERLRELLRGAAVDPQRLAQEAAMLAERGDIAEEIARLKIHAAQAAALLEEGGEVGKRLDFLLQEMNRESNTILSKTGGAGETGLRITELALEAKSVIEKIREQALNLE
jgi:uncharacterized protein (TIGR00255 family)